jgi:glycogen operon protein
MTRRDWESPDVQVVGLFLNGQEIGSRTPEGEPVVDDSCLVVLNACPDRVTFTLPSRRFAATWEVELQTADPDSPTSSFPARGQVAVEARSIVLMRAA